MQKDTRGLDAWATTSAGRRYVAPRALVDQPPPPAWSSQVAFPRRTSDQEAVDRGSAARHQTVATADRTTGLNTTCNFDNLFLAAKKPNCNIDADTEVPEDLFHELVRLGKEARKRGQHVLVSRSQKYGGGVKLVRPERAWQLRAKSDARIMRAGGA